MINWDEVSKTDEIEELKKIKLWLFRENIRLQNERKELEASKERFLSERVKLKNELDQLNRKTVFERKRLKEENLFFEKKMKILTDGFIRLEEERRKFDLEKQKQKNNMHSSYTPQNDSNPSDVVSILFRNANNPLTLRKRYRDLVKIFHPDNLMGDAELMQAINKEFNRRKEDL